MFQSPGPIICQWGFFTLRWYAVMIALGFLVALWIAAPLAKRMELDYEKASNGIFVIFIAGILGARLYYCALRWDYFIHNLIEIPQTWHGGLSIHGGIIAGVLAAIWYCRKTNLPILKSLDYWTCLVPLAQGIGRWGNFFNSEAYGAPVSDDFWLKLYIPPNCRLSEFASSSYYHPTFLYESVWNILLFLFLYFYASKKLANYPGLAFCTYLAGYSLGRILIEPIRIDSVANFMNIPVPLLISALTLALALCFALFLFKRAKTKTA